MDCRDLDKLWLYFSLPLESCCCFLSFIEKIIFASQLIFNKHKRYKKANYFLTDNIKVTNKKQKEFLTQLDGESIIIKSKELNISIKKGALNVLVPKS